MKTLKNLFGASAILLMTSSAFAQFGLFTDAEVQIHKERIGQITQTAAACLQTTWNEHLDFYNKWGVSKFYGDRNKSLDERSERAQALRDANVPSSLIEELEPISCIGLTLRCLGEGFNSAGMGATWTKIMNQLKIDNKMYGTDLQKMLRELGWSALYWNPDPSQNAAWDQEDQTINPLKPGKKWNPVWGGHAYNYSVVMRKGDYYGIKIDDKQTLVGFKTTVPQAFKKVPFFVGTAHSGYHVFPGMFGQVIEGHSARALSSRDNLEVSDFNPLATGGGPRWTRSEKYRSGVIVIPPSADGN